MRISARFGIGPTSIVMAALFGPTFLLVAIAPAGNEAIPFLVAAQLIFGFTVVVYNIVQVSYRQAICPPRLQGRMNSVMRFMVWGTIPLGHARRRRARDVGRAARDDRRRRDRRRVLVPLARSSPRNGTCARCPSPSTTLRLGPADDVMPEPAAV